MVLGISLRRKRPGPSDATDSKESVVESPSLPNIASPDFQWPSDLITDGQSRGKAPVTPVSSPGREQMKQPAGGATTPFHRPFRKDSTTSPQSNGSPTARQESQPRTSIASMYATGRTHLSFSRPSRTRTASAVAASSSVTASSTPTKPPLRNKRRTPHVSPTFNVMVVGGASTGKTSLSRLLLQSCQPSPLATPAQRESVQHFLEGVVSSTTSVQSASLEIDEGPERLILTLMDTPGLMLGSELDLERSVTTIIRLLDNRFSETLEEENKVDRRNKGDQHVHLCIYLIAPESIRPRAPAPPPKAPLTPPSSPPKKSEPVPEAAAPTDSTTEVAAVESSGRETPTNPPPGTAGSSPSQPVPSPDAPKESASTDDALTLSDADVYVIKRLSTRVNVLPVIARADTMTNEHLEEAKTVIRRDLKKGGFHANAILSQIDSSVSDDEYEGSSDEEEDDDAEEDDARAARTVVRIRSTRGAGGQKRRPSIGQRSRSRTRAALTDEDVDFDSSRVILPKGVSSLRALFPFAVMSPDPVPSVPKGEGFAKAEGTVAATPSAYKRRSVTLDSGDHLKGLKGKYTRNYRWGAVDVLNPEHCDFLALRQTILGPRLRVLKETTNEVLYEKFRTQKLLELKQLTRPADSKSPN